ncbi:MAG: DNA polymerase III subunit delta' [Terriglobales bacterium]|jgi:DNA polymerase-3 subunit delta'
MPFSDFHGNSETIERVRAMLASGRLPPSLILAGPRGSGKYFLAQMVAKAMNCLEPPGNKHADFCGHCANCQRISGADDLDARCAEAVEAREGLRDTDRKETRILIQTHPDVIIIPPDPPQLMIKVDQVRHVIGTIYHRPTTGGHRAFIFTDSVFMKEAANSLLKILEEPPDFATILLLTTNAGELLPTIRSRCITLTLSPLAPTEIESYLVRQRPEWTASQRALAARLSDGGLGRALTFDLTGYTAARKDALTLLGSGLNRDDHSLLFRVTESYRAGADGREKTDQLVRTLYSLLHDVMFLRSGTPDLVRNIDIAAELDRLTAGADFHWIKTAVQRLDELQSGMRRNLLRGLALDAFATSLAE